MSAPIDLIVGLGNPGADYAKTRHNVGFWFLDALVSSSRASFTPQSKFFGDTARIRLDGREIWCLKPSTFMNRSGQSVQAMANFYRVSPENILVVHDELDLEPGTIRLKASGGHGGHNGLRDISQRFGSGNYPRLRVGIGHPSQYGGTKNDVSKFVLNRPTAEQEAAILSALDRAEQHISEIVSGQTQKVMNVLHSKQD